MRRKKFIVSGLLLLGALGLVGCRETTTGVEETQEVTEESVNVTDSSSEVEAHHTTSINQELIDAHDERYEEMMTEFQNGEYTLEEPLVVQDPYGRSPLSALVLFETEEPMEMTVTVEGVDEEAILLSARNQDMTIKLTYPAGEIDWVLSYPEGHHEEIEPYLLESIDEDLKYPAGQHAVEEMPDQDGHEATLDIMLFDNNRMFTRGDEELSEAYSRAVQYRINQEDDTVEEIWSYGEESGTELYSDIVSDADYLPESENVLINFGRAPHEETGGFHSVITEVTKTEDPEVVYELHYGPFAVDGVDAYVQMYRAERYPLYPDNQ